MNHIIVTVAKYLNLLFVILYTLKCFSYFTAKNKKKRNSNLNKQIFYIFAMHFLCHVCLYINTEKAYIIYYYLIEISIAIFYIVLFHFAYKHASRLITNNIVFLMLVGYTMLTRLNTQRAIKQFILATAALFICSFIPFIMGKLKDMHKWNMRYAVLGLLLLISVFVPGLGYEAWGSRNWIHIGSLTLQPMEFVKILFILFVASALVKAETMKDIVINSGFAVLFMGVLAIEKDFGAIAIFFVTYVLMVYLATGRMIFMLGGFSLAIIAVIIGYLLFKDSLFSHIMVRVEAWKDPFRYYETGGYQVSQSLFAIGTGGFVGSGLGNGMPSIIPAVENDFIFSAICEELGLVFGLALILIYVSQFIAIVNIAMKCKKPFYKYVTFGIAITYIVQTFLNIGGVIKFIPSTGVTLPLVSYGVSSVFSTLILMNMVQYTYILVSREAEEIEKEREDIIKRAAEPCRDFESGTAGI